MRFPPLALSHPPPYLQFIDVGVENAVYETDARGLVRILVGQFDVDLPDAAFERSCVSRYV
jgi:hypothetical protein